MDVRQLSKLLEAADPESEVLVEDGGQATGATACEITLDQNEFEGLVPWNRIFLISMHGKVKLSLPIQNKGGLGTRPLIQKGKVYK